MATNGGSLPFFLIAIFPLRYSTSEYFVPPNGFNNVRFVFHFHFPHAVFSARPAFVNASSANDGQSPRQARADSHCRPALAC